MNKSLSVFTVAVGFSLIGQASFANDVSQGSSSISAEVSGFFDDGKERPMKWGMGDARRDPIQLKVKLHDNGDIDLDHIQWNTGTVIKRFESVGARIDTRILGAYREELHQKIGAEMGIELLDFKVTKVFKIDGYDETSFIVEAYATVDKVWNIKTNDENYFINENLESFNDDEQRHFRGNGYYLSHGAQAKIKYQTENGYLEAGTFFEDFSNRELKNEAGDRYNYSKSSRGLKITFKPNKKSCHKYTIGLRKDNFSQSLNGLNNGMTDNQIFANYECNINFSDLLPGYGYEDSNKVIRH